MFRLSSPAAAAGLIPYANALALSLQPRLLCHSLELVLTDTKTPGSTQPLFTAKPRGIGPWLLHGIVIPHLYPKLPLLLPQHRMLVTDRLACCVGLVAKHATFAHYLQSPFRGSSPGLAQHTPVGGLRASRVPLRHNTIVDICSGHKVLAYWPVDKQWYKATLGRVSVDIGPLPGALST